MNSEPPLRDWILADLDPLIVSAGRLVAGTAREADRRMVRKYLRREGERALWQVGQAEGEFPAAKAGIERTGTADAALGGDIRDALWRVLSSLGRGHFGLVVAAEAGHIEFAASDPLGLVLLEMARALSRLEPTTPQIRTARCGECGSSMEVKRRHRNGAAVRRFCSPKCKAAAHYRDRVARAAQEQSRQRWECPLCHGKGYVTTEPRVGFGR